MTATGGEGQSGALPTYPCHLTLDEWQRQLSFTLSSGLAHTVLLDQGQHYCAA